MAKTASSDRKTIDKVFILLGTALAAVLITIGGLLWYGYNFATDMVQTELSAQKVFFPAKDSPALAALPAGDRNAMEQYAGQQLVDGQQAKVYADHFIKVHLSEVADGQTYSQVSTAAMKDPTNTRLQQQKTVLFQGETLRGLLLGSGYSYWTFGMIAKAAAIASFIGASAMIGLVWLGLTHLAKMSR